MSIKPKIGDVFAIPLSRGKYAYGRLYKDSSILIYNIKTEDIQGVDVVGSTSPLFFSGVFDTALKNGSWPRIGHIPFESEEESWPPPMYVQDVVNNSQFRIYHKGKMRVAKPGETNGLEKQALRKPEQLMKEIEFRLLHGKC